MLHAIAPYVARYSQIIATVTGINVEVADPQLIRIAGTGRYAEGVGASIEHAGEMYRHVLQGNTTFVMTNPRENDLCKRCKNLGQCRETLSVCTPILHSGQVIGIIGMICFTSEERGRMLPNIDVYRDFVEQMANTIAMVAAEYQKGERTQRLLDMFLQIADLDNRGIIIFNTAGGISYLNDMARKTLGLSGGTDVQNISARRTGTLILDREEFEMSVDGRHSVLLGRLTDLDSDDPTFYQALVFDLLPHYTRLLSQGAHAQEISGLRDIVGESRIMRDLKQQVVQIAQTSSTVLITGESGTGKEMFARAIHAASDRRDKPFIPLNCGAIPDALLESELFGYVSGAFTGANPSGYIGKFELAHQGVIFLDEIGAMPLYLQVKLLRVLQDRRVMRLGSNRIIDVDVRIIAATNEHLPELIQQRMFRDDLYYRLNVIPLNIPPLRMRSEDIPELADFFLDKYCRLFSKKRIHPTARLLEALAAYPWPGNVREFENSMEYLVNIIPDGGSATVSLLPAKICAASAAAPPVQAVDPLPLQALSVASTAVVPLAQVEAQAIAQALAHYGDSAHGKRKAAQALGIGIATLYRKLKQGNATQTLRHVGQ